MPDERPSPFRQGSGFLDVVPVTDIERVEVQGSTTTLPSVLVNQFLTEGRFDLSLRRNARGSTTAVRVRLKDGGCFQFDVHVDPVVRRISSSDTATGPMSVPDVPETCRAIAVPVKPGMTRAQVKHSLEHDLGIIAPFVDERYVVRNSECGPQGESLKVELSFHPANKPDPAQHVPIQSQHDVVIRVSPACLEIQALIH